ncbi:MAG: DUF4476 domain-containing protein [Chitinophagales bacterium]
MQGLKANYMDGDKVKYIKANLNDENLDIDQVQIVLNEVFFESNKVEAYKFLYTRKLIRNNETVLMIQFSACLVFKYLYHQLID